MYRTTTRSRSKKVVPLHHASISGFKHKRLCYSASFVFWFCVLKRGHCFHRILIKFTQRGWCRNNKLGTFTHELSCTAVDPTVPLTIFDGKKKDDTGMNFLRSECLAFHGAIKRRATEDPDHHHRALPTAIPSR